MKAFKLKNRSQKTVSRHLIFIFSVLITSCVGQIKTNTKQNNITITDTVSKDTIVKDKNDQNFGLIFQNANSNEQISQVVRKIFQDTKGNLWFGTQSGACQYDGTALIYFDDIKDEFGKGTTIKDIAEDKDGNIWFGHTGGISKYNGQSITNYSEKEGLLNNDVWSIAVDSHNTLWIGTLQGLCYFDGETFTPFPLPESKPDRTRGVTSGKIVHDIMQNSKGQMWFSTNGGAYSYNGVALSNISEKDGLCNNNVDTILEDHKGNMWFATTHNGLCYFDGESFKTIKQSKDLEGKEIWDIYQDQSDNIWITGKHIGVYKYNNKSLTHFGKVNGLDTAGIMSVFEDKQGRLWFGGVNGLFRLDGTYFTNITRNGPWDN